jgi:uncharacterized protein YndB with AHSA1/START domain
METLEFKITIAAPAQHVWNTMLDDKTYREWTGESWPGSFYEGAWKEGNTLRFIGPDGSGTLAKLTHHRPYTFSRAEHLAILRNGGVEDRDSPEAKNWIGTTESYTFTETPGGTTLLVRIETHPDFTGMFKDGWQNALAKLKEMCERQPVGSL